MNRKRKGSVVFNQGKDGRGKLDFQVWGAVSWRGLWRHSSKQFLFLRGIKEGTCGRREWEQRRKREDWRTGCVEEVAAALWLWQRVGFLAGVPQGTQAWP